MKIVLPFQKIIIVDIRELHNKAMELASLADFQKVQKNKDDAISLYEQSYSFEYEAAMSAYENGIGEPTVLEKAGQWFPNIKRRWIMPICLLYKQHVWLSGLNWGIVKHGQERKTLLTESREKIAEVIRINQSESDTPNNKIEKGSNQNANGILKVANANTNIVEIIADGISIKMKVPDGLSDIVKTYWDEKVVVEYQRINKKEKLLINIEGV